MKAVLHIPELGDLTYSFTKGLSFDEACTIVESAVRDSTNKCGKVVTRANVISGKREVVIRFEGDKLVRETVR